MTTRDLKSTISVGGAIASSLPSSMKRAGKELERLKTLQAADEAQARKLKREIGLLSKGTEEYRAKVAQLKEVSGRLNLREDKLTKAGIAARGAGMEAGGLTGRIGQLRKAAGPAALALGGIATVAGILAGALLKASNEAQELITTTTLTGADVAGYQQLVAYVREFTNDAGKARGAAASIVESLQDLRQVRFGKQLNQEFVRGLSRVGIGIGEAINLNERDFLNQTIRGLRQIRDADERALAAEELFQNADARAAALRAAEDERLNQDAQRRADAAHIRSITELEASRSLGTRVDELKERVGDLIVALADKATPAILRLVDLIGRIPGVNVPEPPPGYPVYTIPGEPPRPRPRAPQSVAADFIQDQIIRGISAGFNALVGRQRGGYVRPGERTLVGEDGPEIAEFPAGTRIVPNAGGRTVQYITIYATINNPQGVADLELALADAAGSATESTARS